MSDDEDPCQSTVDAIDHLRQVLLDLEAELQDAPGPARSIIFGLMANTRQRIREETSALERCRRNPPPLPPPPFVVTFAGTATVRTDNDQARGPFVGNFSIGLTFSRDHARFFVTGFRTNVHGIPISQKSGGQGTFDRTTGAAELEIEFTLGLPIVGDATLSFSQPHEFTTEQSERSGPFAPRGSRLDRATGQITLAAASSISENIFANGTNVEVVLTGVFDPLP